MWQLGVNGVEVLESADSAGGSMRGCHNNNANPLPEGVRFIQGDSETCMSGIGGIGK